ncbi:hypothetical protein K439DRAFT_1665990 [Ramaria rubella]|nr:hypothetical protein K439DRAFT_1665990 [Ramaria rubella]
MKATVRDRSSRSFKTEWPCEPVHLSSHDPLLPRFLLYNHHPLWPHGKAYVYEADTSVKAQKALLEHAKERKISGRFEDELRKEGEMQLLPYEAVFTWKKGQRDPCQDVIQLWVTDERLYDTISSTFQDEVTQIQEDILGPINKRQTGRPRKNAEGDIVGGFHSERSFHRSKPVRDDGSRCYQFQGLSMEKPRAVSSVNANSKLPDDQDHKLQNRMLKTFTAIGVAAMKLAPASVQHAAQLKAELVNSPPIGQDNNFYHQENQINISQAQSFDSPSIISELGPFGERHNDNEDNEARYSNASVHSHLPDNYHPGIFIFYELDRNINFCFSGLRYHGGTPATAPEDSIPTEWTRQSLAALPGGVILYVTPEMQEHCDYRLWSTRSAYVTDGAELMTCKAHMAFVSRLLLRVHCSFNALSCTEYDHAVMPTHIERHATSCENRSKHFLVQYQL